MRPGQEVLDSLPLPAYICRADGSVELFNAAAAALWEGCPPYVAWTPLDGDAVLERADGSRKYLLAHTRTLLDDHGRRSTLHVVADVTAREEAARIARARQDVADADRRKDEFLATLSHELRGPLAPIMSAVTVMGLSDSDEPQRQACRAMIERQVGHLVRLIEDLLDVSQLTTGKLELKREAVSLAQVVRSGIETARPVLQQYAHDLKLSRDERAAFVDADPSRLAEVFANLLSNAAKFSPDGSAIHLDVTERPDGVVVSVRDHGLGILPERLERIFEPFVQYEMPPGRSRTGLGLGLTIARRIVEMHGGRLTVWSDGAGMGSTFSVWLPTTEVRSEMPPPLIGGSRTRHRVLVVDDNCDSATGLSALLEAMGHETRTAFDGEEALTVAEIFEPDVVVLDIAMPGMDGYEVAKRLRARQRGKLTLVALTGWGDRARTANAGFDQHLMKPADMATLEQLLGNC